MESTKEIQQGYEDNRFESAVSPNFHCPICLNILKDPVMCRKNQHYFCTPCITKHLGNSSTCPTCMEELTVETLTRVPRIVADCLGELSISCDYFNGGCQEVMLLNDLKRHVYICGFSPIKCSNDGCNMTVNKRDKVHHETELCDFRKVKCHDCRELKKEVAEMKDQMTAQGVQMTAQAVQMYQMEEKIMKGVSSLLIEIRNLKEEKSVKKTNSRADTNKSSAKKNVCAQNRLGFGRRTTDWATPPTADWATPPTADWGGPTNPDWGQAPIADWGGPTNPDWGQAPIEDWGQAPIEDWGQAPIGDWGGPTW